jgi:hypothetical protein
MVKNKDLVRQATEEALQNTDILSVVIIKDDQAGIGGTVEVKFI